MKPAQSNPAQPTPGPSDPARVARPGDGAPRPVTRTPAEADALELAPDVGPARCHECGEMLVEVDRVFHCPACRARMARDRRTGLPEAWKQGAKAPAAARSDLHTECPDCGYDLRGLRGDATCPECGLANAASIVLAGDDEFAGLPPAFLRSMTRRFVVVTVAVWCAPLMLALGRGLAIWFGTWMWLLGAVGATCCLALSAWALSAPIARAEGVRNGFGARDRVRLGTRWTILGLGLAVIESIGVWGTILGGAIGGALDVVLLAITLLATAGHAALRAILLIRAGEWVGSDSGQFFAKMSFLTALLSGAFVVLASLIGLLIAPTGGLLFLGLPMRGLSTLLYAVGAALVLVGVLKARNDRRQWIDRRRDRIERESEPG